MHANSLIWGNYLSFFFFWKVLWRPTRPSRTNTKNDVLFIIGEWNGKVGNQRYLEKQASLTLLPRKHTGHSKHLLPATQEMTLYMEITRWSIVESDWLYSLQPKMEKLHTVSKNKTRSWLWLRSWTPYFAKLIFKLKKVGNKTIQVWPKSNPLGLYSRSTNRFKGLDLKIQCLKNYGQSFLRLYKRQWPRPSPRKRNVKTQNGCLRSPYK